MTTTPPARPTLDDLARLGTEAYARHVKPSLTPADDGKLVAIDVRTGAFEIDEDDYSAVARLEARVPGAAVWLERVGQPTVERLRSL
jgi:hypothetical protein